MILVDIGREEETLEILGADIYHVWEEEERKQARMGRRTGYQPGATSRTAHGLGPRRRGRQTLQQVAGRIAAGQPDPRRAAPVDRPAVAQALRAGRNAQADRAARAGSSRRNRLPPPPVVADTPPEQTQPEPEPVRSSRIRPSRCRIHRPYAAAEPHAVGRSSKPPGPEGTWPLVAVAPQAEGGQGRHPGIP